MENLINEDPQHQNYRNEKVFNSGKAALELNFLRQMAVLILSLRGL